MKDVFGLQEAGSSERVPAPFDVTMQPTLSMKTVLPGVPTSRKRPPGGKRRRSRLVVLYCYLGLFVLALSLFGCTLYLYHNYNTEYHRDMALAQEGVHHLQTAESLLKNFTRGSLDAQSITRVRQEFAKASAAFGQVQNDLKQVPGIATTIPKYGSLFSAALKLVPLALEVSQAGMVGCNMLMIVISHLHEPLGGKAQGITMGDITSIKKDVAQIQGILDIAANQVKQLQPSDLQVDSRLSPAIATIRSNLPAIQTGLQDIQSVLSVAPTLLGIGQPASFLIEQLDSTEIRPGGGFIGSYGITTLSGGQLASIQMRDTYLLDKPFEYSGHSIPYPSAYRWFSGVAPASWSLRDSNLDADFPTAARNAEQIYHSEGGTVSLQGVIAITPWLVENALKITGPIYVPEYHETITAQNVVDRIHYHQLEDLQGGDVSSPDGHSSLRKRFTELLFEHFFARVRQIWPTSAWQFVSLLRNSLSTKDFQIYFNSSAVEGLLQGYKLASTIQAPQADSLFTVDANIAGGKPNNFIRYTSQDEVTIDAPGNAIHRLTLTYNWPVSANPFQNGFGIQSVYTDYIRVYVPPGSTLLMQNGWEARGTSIAFGREVWAGLFRLPYGQTRKVNLTWMVHGAATHNAHGWHYHYLIQRQAGITWNVSLHVTLPTCARIASTPSKLALGNQHTATLNQALTTDLDVGMNYSC